MKITKDRIIFLIVASIILSIVSSFTTYATNYLYNSNEVSYNNNESGISSDNVQGAIDNLYEQATNYNTLDNRVSSLEKYFKNNPSSYIAKKPDGEWLFVAQDNSVSDNRGVAIYDKNSKLMSTYYYDSVNDMVYISSYSATSGFGKGKLSLYGNPVLVNGSLIPTIKHTSKSVTSNGSGLIEIQNGMGIAANAHAIVCESMTSNKKVSQAIRWNNLWYIALTDWNSATPKPNETITLQCTWMVD